MGGVTWMKTEFWFCPDRPSLPVHFSAGWKKPSILRMAVPHSNQNWRRDLCPTDRIPKKLDKPTNPILLSLWQDDLWDIFKLIFHCHHEKFFSKNSNQPNIFTHSRHSKGTYSRWHSQLRSKQHCSTEIAMAATISYGKVNAVLQLDCNTIRPQLRCRNRHPVSF